MLPPRLVRRLIAAPLVVAIAAALAVLAPPVAILSLAFNLIRRRTGRMRLLRVVCFALVWFLGETAALAVLGCLWIVSGFGGRLDTEPYQSRHYGVIRRLLGLMYRTAKRTCGLRVDVAGPPRAESAGPGPRAERPLIVLSRHAGPGDSLLLVHHLLSACGRRPRVVMKAALQLDPSLDIAANRLPNAFVHRRSRASAGTSAGASAGTSAGADGAALAPRRSPAAAPWPRSSGRTGRCDAQCPAAARRRGARGGRRLSGRGRGVRRPYRPGPADQRPRRLGQLVGRHRDPRPLVACPRRGGAARGRPRRPGELALRLVAVH